MLVRCGTENILREWYSIDTNLIEINDVATRSLEKGINKMVPGSFYKGRYNLKRLIMKAVVVKGSSFINVKKDGEFGGTFGELLKELCTILNFSFDVFSELKEFGRWNPEKRTWSGAISELYAGHADICLSGFSVTTDRLNVVDFTLPFLNIKNFLVIQEPEKFGIKWSSYFLTFTNSVWIAILGILITSSILLIFLKIHNGTDRQIRYLFIDNFLEIWGIFCQQGLAGLIQNSLICVLFHFLNSYIYAEYRCAIDFPDRFSLKLASLHSLHCNFSILLFVTVLLAAYSADLISYLTSTIHILTFHSLESFVEDGTYQLAVVRGSAYYDKFAIYKNQKLAIYSIHHNNAVNLEMPCNVIRINTGHVNNIAMILSKHNPFTGVFNFQLQKFFDNGIVNRLKNSPFEEKCNDMIKAQPA